MNRRHARLGAFTIALTILSITRGHGFDEVKPGEVEKIKAALPDTAPAKPKKARKVLIFT